MRSSAWVATFIVSAGLAGCSSATDIVARAPGKPLDAIASAAADEYSVERVDDRTLRLQDSWVWSSIGGLGYYASIATIYDDPASDDLQIRYYLRANPLMTLWIPMYLDAEPGMVGAAQKSTMNDQINDILRWGGATLTTRARVDRDQPWPKAPSAAPAVSP